MYNLLKNKRLILSLPLFLAASLFLPSHIVPLGHAQFTGLVCVTSSTTATSCPSSSATIGPLTPGSTFTVGVFIQGSDAMGGYDIYVRSDPSFVSPASAALGSLIVTPSLTSICVNGSAQTGSCTVGTANGPGVVEVTTIEASGSNECGGISPCSGMAFTITYTVVAATASTSLSYPTAAGCATSSVSSPANTCVLVDDATGTTLPENIQGATINIVLPPAVICILSPTTLTNCPNGTPSYPETYGSTFTVGVFVQGSAPLGGYDIYVSADPHYLNPINAALGTLITSPSLTSICIDGTLQTGSSCGAANGPGIVEVTTIESSGGNDPGTGLAFTITYQVVGVTPGTLVAYPASPDCSNSSISSPPNTCVLVADNVGTTLPEHIQPANITQTHGIDPVSISKSCAPNPVVVGQPATCTVIVNDIAASGRIPPISVPPFFNSGQPTWSSGGFGSFNPNACTLSAINASASSCQVTYQPAAVGSGSHSISVLYAGDTIHSGSSDPTNLIVQPATPTIATAVIVDQTGEPVNATTGVPFGLTVHDTVIFNGGYPVTGATGSVTYTLYPNGVCKPGTGTVVSTVPVGQADNVPNSASQRPAVGSNSFNAMYTPDVNNNFAVTSACEQFTVTASPHFASGKLSWTHHLSLSKSSNTQSWTAIVANPFTTSVKVVVRIVGFATNGNPSLSFDITCGVTCVNTGSGVNFTPGLTPVTVAAGASSFSFSFNQLYSSGYSNQKVQFTATLYWATGTLYTQSDSKSGAFAVVP